MVVRSSFDRSYWVIAEIVSLSEAKNGHLYMEIAEKENDFLQAKIKANIWANSKRRILSQFETSTNQTLKKGMKVLVNVTIDFHTVFGLSLNVLDIDPNFSLGEIERQKQATLLALQQDGLIDFNKQHVLSPVLQTIAIISSETAAGYQDFKKQLSENAYDYQFRLELFQATMQGETAAESILQALNRTEESEINFDVVVLIRGGGSALDLGCFDEYALAAGLAQSSFPIFTGIGHERDNSVADKVAHTALKTPTAVADYIVSHNRNFEIEMENQVQTLNQFAYELLDDQKLKWSHLSRNLSHSSQLRMNAHSKRLAQHDFHYQKAVNNRIRKAYHRLDKIKFILKHDLKIKFQQMDTKLDNKFQKIVLDSKSLLKNQEEKLIIHDKSLIKGSLQTIKTDENKLMQMTQLFQMADPKKILKKGFSITRVNGKLLRTIDQVKTGDQLQTELCEGILESSMTKKYKNEQEIDL